MAGQRLYDTDFYAWTQDQAEKLRAVRDNRLDAENLAEEVADLGRSELRAVDSHLDQLLIHLLKAVHSPADRPRAHWLNEADHHWKEARKAFSPGMRAKLDLAENWRTAVRRTNRELVGYGEPPLPDDLACPFTLDELLAETFDVDAAVRRLSEDA